MWEIEGDFLFFLDVVALMAFIYSARDMKPLQREQGRQTAKGHRLGIELVTTAGEL